MRPRERLLCALGRGTPDRVPYFEYGVNRDVVRRAFGECPDDPVAFNRLVRKCDLEVWRKPPIFVRSERTPDGRDHITEGLVKTREDYRRLFRLPDPLAYGKGREDPAAVEQAARFVENKAEFAVGLVISLSADPVFLSMGLDGFAFALADDPGLIREMLDRYADWTIAILEEYRQLGFDFVLCGDDLAHKTSPFVSPAVFRDILLPAMRRVAKAIRRPWILHSDGNLMPIWEDLLGLGMSAVNPFEPGALDIVQIKRDYGDRIAVSGNFDLNVLSLGTPEQTREDVRRKMEALKPGGGYIASSSNTIPAYVKPENFRAMLDAVEEFGAYSTSSETSRE